MQLKAGTTLQNGKYKIIRVLGQGGFGITYLAENTLLEKNVAIKEFFPKDFCGRDNTSHITPGTQNNADTVEKLKNRFLNEAKNIAKLDHPGIVKIYDMFEENNTAYYVMDYIEGENLNDIVKRNGPLSESKAIDYIIDVGYALEYIHSRQMTHFDVKPSNIVVCSYDDYPILIDFGLSKQYDNHGDATSTLMQAVSHGYSPIELYNLGSLSSFSPQADVYSLAATLYFLLTGIVPPNASQLVNEQLWFPSSFHEKLKGSIVKAMTASRRNRTENVASFINELRNAISQNFNRTKETTIIKDYDNHSTQTYSSNNYPIQQSDKKISLYDKYFKPLLETFDPILTPIFVLFVLILIWSPVILEVIPFFISYDFELSSGQQYTGTFFELSEWAQMYTNIKSDNLWWLIIMSIIIITAVTFFSWNFFIEPSKKFINGEEGIGIALIITSLGSGLFIWFGLLDPDDSKLISSASIRAFRDDVVVRYFLYSAILLTIISIIGRRLSNDWW